MIRIVAAANRRLLEDELREFDRMRGTTLVGGRATIARRYGGGSGRPGHDEAIHILVVADGRISAGSRLTPTLKPHLLSEVFPHLAAARGVPRDPAIYEWTCLVVAETPRARDSERAAGTALSALLEYCLDERVRALSAIIAAASLPRFHDMGWTIRPLGLPEFIDGEWTLAVTMPIDGSTLASTRAFHGIDASIVVRRNVGSSVTREVGYEPFTT